MKIYTSYFANRKLKDVFTPDMTFAISAGMPKEMNCERLPALAPSWQLLQDYKNGKVDWDGYTRQYVTQLDALGVEKIAPMLKDGAVYLCFEGKDKNCHRHLLAKWVRENIAGVETEEV